MWFSMAALRRSYTLDATWNGGACCMGKGVEDGDAVLRIYHSCYIPGGVATRSLLVPTTPTPPVSRIIIMGHADGLVFVPWSVLLCLVEVDESPTSEQDQEVDGWLEGGATECRLLEYCWSVLAGPFPVLRVACAVPVAGACLFHGTSQPTANE